MPPMVHWWTQDEPNLPDHLRPHMQGGIGVVPSCERQTRPESRVVTVARSICMQHNALRWQSAIGQHTVHKRQRVGVDALRGLGPPLHDGNTSGHLFLPSLLDLLVEERSRRIEHRAQQAGVRDLVMARCYALHTFRVRFTPRPPMMSSG